MRLLSLFGLDLRLRRLRILAGEMALAAEDRAQLLRLAWEEEKHRLRWAMLLVIAVVGLTPIAVALLSVAMVVHFWDTPHRAVAAWSVSAVWIAVWIAAVAALASMMRKASGTFDPAREELERDWLWIQERLGLTPDDDSPPEPRPRTREELLARIERQRERIAVLQTPPSPAPSASDPPADESPRAMAMRIAREHPVVTGVAVAAAVAVLKPRRLLRWAAVIAPVLWRMR